jgi:Flp pilus assembly protein CpaB
VRALRRSILYAYPCSKEVRATVRLTGQSVRMTPAPLPAPRSGRGGFAVGLLIGLGCSGLLLCLGSGVGYAVVQRQKVAVRKGWNLVPVVVAAVDITEHTVVTMDQVSQRSMPEQFVTASVVKPDSASYIINQTINVPVQAGDPLLWSQFDTTAKQVKVLFAARDLASGTLLAAHDAVERGAPPDLVTASWVRTEDRPQALGRPLIAPFRKGDPILWTHLRPQGEP